MLCNMVVKALKETFDHRASRFDKNTSATTINLSFRHDHHHILKQPRLKGAHQMTPPAKIAVTHEMESTTLKTHFHTLWLGVNL